MKRFRSSNFSLSSSRIQQQQQNLITSSSSIIFSFSSVSNTLLKTKPFQRGKTPPALKVSNSSTVLSTTQQQQTETVSVNKIVASEVNNKKRSSYSSPEVSSNSNSNNYNNISYLSAPTSKTRAVAQVKRLFRRLFSTFMVEHQQQLPSHSCSFSEPIIRTHSERFPPRFYSSRIVWKARRCVLLTYPEVKMPLNAVDAECVAMAAACLTTANANANSLLRWIGETNDICENFVVVSPENPKNENVNEEEEEAEYEPRMPEILPAPITSVLNLNELTDVYGNSNSSASFVPDNCASLKSTLLDRLEIVMDQIDCNCEIKFIVVKKKNKLLQEKEEQQQEEEETKKSIIDGVEKEEEESRNENSNGSNNNLSKSSKSFLSSYYPKTRNNNNISDNNRTVILCKAKISCDWNQRQDFFTEHESSTMESAFDMCYGSVILHSRIKRYQLQLLDFKESVREMELFATDENMARENLYLVGEEQQQQQQQPHEEENVLCSSSSSSLIKVSFSDDNNINNDSSSNSSNNNNKNNSPKLKLIDRFELEDIFGNSRTVHAMNAHKVLSAKHQQQYGEVEENNNNNSSSFYGGDFQDQQEQEERNNKTSQKTKMSMLSLSISELTARMTLLSLHLMNPKVLRNELQTMHWIFDEFRCLNNNTSNTKEDVKDFNVVISHNNSKTNSTATSTQQTNSSSWSHSSWNQHESNNNKSQIVSSSTSSNQTNGSNSSYNISLQSSSSSEEEDDGHSKPKTEEILSVENSQTILEGVRKLFLKFLSQQQEEEKTKRKNLVLLNETISKISQQQQQQQNENSSCHFMPLLSSIKFPFWAISSYSSSLLTTPLSSQRSNEISKLILVQEKLIQQQEENSSSTSSSSSCLSVTEQELGFDINDAATAFIEHCSQLVGNYRPLVLLPIFELSKLQHFCTNGSSVLGSSSSNVVCCSNTGSMSTSTTTTTTPTKSSSSDYYSSSSQQQQLNVFSFQLSSAIKTNAAQEIISQILRQNTDWMQLSSSVVQEYFSSSKQLQQKSNNNNNNSEFKDFSQIISHWSKNLNSEISNNWLFIQAQRLFPFTTNSHAHEKILRPISLLTGMFAATNTTTKSSRNHNYNNYFSSCCWWGLPSCAFLLPSTMIPNTNNSNSTSSSQQKNIDTEKSSKIATAVVDEQSQQQQQNTTVTTTKQEQHEKFISQQFLLNGFQDRADTSHDSFLRSIMLKEFLDEKILNKNKQNKNANNNNNSSFLLPVFDLSMSGTRNLVERQKMFSSTSSEDKEKEKLSTSTTKITQTSEHNVKRIATRKVVKLQSQSQNQQQQNDETSTTKKNNQQKEEDKIENIQQQKQPTIQIFLKSISPKVIISQHQQQQNSSSSTSSSYFTLNDIEILSKNIRFAVFLENNCGLVSLVDLNTNNNTNENEKRSLELPTTSPTYCYSSTPTTMWGLNSTNNNSSCCYPFAAVFELMNHFIIAKKNSSSSSASSSKNNTNNNNKFSSSSSSSSLLTSQLFYDSELAETECNIIVRLLKDFYYKNFISFNNQQQQQTEIEQQVVVIEEKLYHFLFSHLVSSWVGLSPNFVSTIQVCENEKSKNNNNLTIFEVKMKVPSVSSSSSASSSSDLEIICGSGFSKSEALKNALLGNFGVVIDVSGFTSSLFVENNNNNKMPLINVSAVADGVVSSSRNIHSDNKNEKSEKKQVIDDSNNETNYSPQNFKLSLKELFFNNSQNKGGRRSLSSNNSNINLLLNRCIAPSHELVILYQLLLSLTAKSNKVPTVKARDETKQQKQQQKLDSSSSSSLFNSRTEFYAINYNSNRNKTSSSVFVSENENQQQQQQSNENQQQREMKTTTTTQEQRNLFSKCSTYSSSSENRIDAAKISLMTAVRAVVVNCAPGIINIPLPSSENKNRKKSSFGSNKSQQQDKSSDATESSSSGPSHFQQSQNQLQYLRSIISDAEMNFFIENSKSFLPELIFDSSNNNEKKTKTKKSVSFSSPKYQYPDLWSPTFCLRNTIGDSLHVTIMHVDNNTYRAKLHIQIDPVLPSCAVKFDNNKNENKNENESNSNNNSQQEKQQQQQEKITSSSAGYTFSGLTVDICQSSDSNPLTAFEDVLFKALNGPLRETERLMVAMRKLIFFLRSPAVVMTMNWNERPFVNILSSSSSSETETDKTTNNNNLFYFFPQVLFSSSSNLDNSNKNKNNNQTKMNFSSCKKQFSKKSDAFVTIVDELVDLVLEEEPELQDMLDDCCDRNKVFSENSEADFFFQHIKNEIQNFKFLPVIGKKITFSPRSVYRTNLSSSSSYNSNNNNTIPRDVFELLGSILLKSKHSSSSCSTVDANKQQQDDNDPIQLSLVECNNRNNKIKNLEIKIFNKVVDIVPSNLTSLLSALLHHTFCYLNAIDSSSSSELWTRFLLHRTFLVKNQLGSLFFSHSQHFASKDQAVNEFLETAIGGSLSETSLFRNTSQVSGEDEHGIVSNNFLLIQPKIKIRKNSLSRKKNKNIFKTTTTKSGDEDVEEETTEAEEVDKKNENDIADKDTIEIELFPDLVVSNQINIPTSQEKQQEQQQKQETTPSASSSPQSSYRQKVYTEFFRLVDDFLGLKKTTSLSSSENETSSSQQQSALLSEQQQQISQQLSTTALFSASLEMRRFLRIFDKKDFSLLVETSKQKNIAVMNRDSIVSSAEEEGKKGTTKTISSSVSSLNNNFDGFEKTFSIDVSTTTSSSSGKKSSVSSSSSSSKTTKKLSVRQNRVLKTFGESVPILLVDKLRQITATDVLDGLRQICWECYSFKKNNLQILEENENEKNEQNQNNNKRKTFHQIISCHSSGSAQHEKIQDAADVVIRLLFPKQKYQFSSSSSKNDNNNKYQSENHSSSEKESKLLLECEIISSSDPQRCRIPSPFVRRHMKTVRANKLKEVSMKEDEENTKNNKNDKFEIDTNFVEFGPALFRFYAETISTLLEEIIIIHEEKQQEKQTSSNSLRRLVEENAISLLVDCISENSILSKKHKTNHQNAVRLGSSALELFYGPSAQVTTMTVQHNVSETTGEVDFSSSSSSSSKQNSKSMSKKELEKNLSAGKLGWTTSMSVEVQGCCCDVANEEETKSMVMINNNNNNTNNQNNINTKEKTSSSSSNSQLGSKRRIVLQRPKDSSHETENQQNNKKNATATTTIFFKVPEQTLLENDETSHSDSSTTTALTFSIAGKKNESITSANYDVLQRHGVVGNEGTALILTGNGDFSLLMV